MQVLPSAPCIARRGRWITGPHGEITTSWAGSSIKFEYHGQSIVQITTGPSTCRMDPLNGGVPTLHILVSDRGDGREIFTRIQDVQGEKTLTMFDSSSHTTASAGVTIELTVIDWASTLEIRSILAEENKIHLPSSTVQAVEALVVGDSISCGWTDEDGSMPLGCVSAYPYLLKKLLRDDGISVEVNLVAYPGWRLVDKRGSLGEEGYDDPLGMESRFFHSSPWGREAGDFDQDATIAIVALGTNDEAQDIPPRVFAARMINFVGRLLGTAMPCKDVVLIEPFEDFNEKDGLVSPYDLVSISQSLDQQHPATTFHILRVRNHLGADHTTDGLHLTSEGQEIVASLLKDLFNSTICQRAC